MIRLKLDVATLRVIYFTENQGEVLHYSPSTLDYDYQFGLPSGMSLSNCWNWTLRGNTLVNTETKSSPVKTLLDKNKEEVKKLLVKKINSTRAPFLSKYDGGTELREEKLNAVQNNEVVFLESLSKAANVTVDHYKTTILNRKIEVELALKNTEINKEYYQRLIKEALTNDDLFLIRDEFNNSDLTKICIP